MAEGGADSVYLVRGDAGAHAAAADQDAALRAAVRERPADGACMPGESDVRTGPTDSLDREGRFPMGVPGFRRPAVLLIAAAAATLLFMFSSGSKTTAVSFGPGYFAALSSTALGADADITTIFSLPAPDSLPSGGPAHLAVP